MKKLVGVLLLILAICVFCIGCAKEEQPEVPVVGGYGDARDLTAEDIEILNEALGADAVKYEADRVETQVVAGMNYKFYAKDLETGEAVFIIVFRSLEESEKPVITEISPIE